ncbi:hypothetical protein QQZ08_001173 [Neonectria magnoliae]|uniref:Uncharacterized protein n=1 Tax=Neonectria magnoliae TaxID=2732573 RepID=A0ABR1IH81_9HYPO
MSDNTDDKKQVKRETPGLSPLDTAIGQHAKVAETEEAVKASVEEILAALTESTNVMIRVTRSWKELMKSESASLWAATAEGETITLSPPHIKLKAFLKRVYEQKGTDGCGGRDFKGVAVLFWWRSPSQPDLGAITAPADENQLEEPAWRIEDLVIR